MDNRLTGLYHKYNVQRVDETDQVGGKHHGCEYFVLDITHDLNALPALRAYAEACEAKYPVLAREIRERLQSR